MNQCIHAPGEHTCWETVGWPRVACCVIAQTSVHYSCQPVSDSPPALSIFRAILRARGAVERGGARAPAVAEGDAPISTPRVWIWSKQRACRIEGDTHHTDLAFAHGHGFTRGYERSAIP
jgi:hypothetical protein